MDFKEHSKEIWTLYNSLDWNSSIFSDKKSLVCALISELAYEHLPQFELNKKSRIKIIPSETYWLKYQRKETFNISDVLGDMDFADNFIIESENLILIGIKLKETLFITVRGTQSLNDVLVDINFLPRNNYSFHSGFFKASINELQNIKTELNNYSNCNIYLTGHSLGGAVASILNNLMEVELKDFLNEKKLTVKSCYTFGMPRFGNSNAMRSIISPYQIYNPNDIVPLLPPKSFGYQNVPIEYKLTNNIVLKPNRGKSTIMRLWGLLTLGDFTSHFISLYCNRLRNL